MTDNSTKTAKRRVPGKPFVKGDPRINRGGRPKLSEEARIEIAALWPNACKRLKDLMNSSDDSVALKAVSIALDRSMGVASDIGALQAIDDAKIATGNRVPVIDDDKIFTRDEMRNYDELQELARARVDIEV